MKNQEIDLKGSVRKYNERFNESCHSMRIVIKNLGKIFKTTFNEWLEKDPFRQSAVIAYYAIFAIPGLLVLIITITGYFFGKETVNENILAQVSSTMGADTAVQIKEMLANAGQTKSTIVGSIIGIITLLVGATGVFVELQKLIYYSGFF